MKKVMLFAFILSAVLMLMGGACAESCLSTQVGTTRNFPLQNGCGTITQVCKCITCSPGVRCFNAGCSWGQTSPINCIANSNSSNPCCASPCGYATGYFSDCRYCSYTGTHVNVQDYSSCHYSPGGTCYVGTCYMKPEIVEYHDAWNLSDRTMQRNLSIHTELYDNVSLQSMNIRICKEESTKCFNETLNLSGTGFIGYFEMPEDAKAWIDANAISYSVFDVSINVSNAAGLSSASEDMFQILGEDIPQIDLSPVQNMQFGEKAMIAAKITERLSGIRKVEIYTDNALSQSCTTSPCSYGYLPSEGDHSYSVIVYDNAGNPNSASGNFSVSRVEKTCSEIGGALCLESEMCTNEQYVKTFDAEKCCTSSCYSSELNLTCSSQNGMIYDPSLKVCSADIPATDTISPNRCCAVQPADIVPIIVQEKSAYWTDSIGNRIFGTGLQESVKCVSTGISDSLQISKDGEVKAEGKNSELSVKVDGLGQYVCTATYSDGTQKEASLTVTDVPAPNSIIRARLPGFGILQFSIALMLISLYYFMRNRK